MRWSYRLVAFIVRVPLRILFGLKLHNIKNVPLTGRLLVVSNHKSEFDPPLLGSVIPREIWFAAKIELFKGWLGKFIAHLNAVPIRRRGSDKEALTKLTNELKQDHAVLIFPEGTRSSEKEGLEFKAGVGMLALRGGADILPVRVDGTDTWKRSLLRPGGFQVRFGEVIRLADIAPEGIERREAYRRIAEELRTRILAMAPEA
jgi:1-acyl-sn-glycerol-3-phosphate acyltransferase